MNPAIDHLVFATTDLDQTVRQLEHRLGVTAVPGGRHAGRGTQNALIALAPESYLEIVGPDPAQRQTEGPRWFGIDAIGFPRLVTWAVKCTDPELVAARAADGRVALGPVVSGSRQRPDGTVLNWRFTDPATMVCDGLVPFFIDWGGSVHPAAYAPAGPVLLNLRAEHPDPPAVIRALTAVGVELAVDRGSQPRLIASLGTAGGRVILT
jgi:hypothetical protein